jgi:hypothetical protein
MAKSLARDLRSFVTFALALRPALIMQQSAEEDGTGLTLTISATEDLSEPEIASLKPLMARYKPLKPYLDGILKLDKLDGSVTISHPTVNFSPNVHYRLVRITEEQYRIAKEVAARLERIYHAHSANDLKSAKSEYDSFHEFLAQQRATLIGEFQGIHFTNAVATYGVGSVGADFVETKVAIFVIIELYVDFPFSVPKKGKYHAPEPHHPPKKYVAHVRWQQVAYVPERGVSIRRACALLWVTRSKLLSVFVATSAIGQRAGICLANDLAMDVGSEDRDGPDFIQESPGRTDRTRASTASSETSVSGCNGFGIE